MKNSSINRLRQFMLLGFIGIMTVELSSCVHEPFAPEIKSIISKSTPFHEVDRIPCAIRPEYGRPSLDDPELKLRDSLYLTDIKENPFNNNELALLFETVTEGIYVYIYDIELGQYKRAYSGNALGRLKWLSSDKIVIDGLSDILVVDIPSSKIVFRHYGFYARTSPYLGHFSFMDNSGWRPKTRFYNENFEEILSVNRINSDHIWDKEDTSVYYVSDSELIKLDVGNASFDTLLNFNANDMSSPVAWSPNNQGLLSLKRQGIFTSSIATGETNLFLEGCSNTRNTRDYHSINYFSCFNSYVVSESEWKLEIDEDAVFWKLNWYRVDLNGEFIDKVEFRVPDEIKGKR